MKRISIKKILVGGAIVGVLFTPFLRVNYYTGNALETRYYSVVTSLISDVIEKDFQTPAIIYGNIYDRITETYNDIVYK